LEIQLTPYSIEVLTGSYQASGVLSPRGHPGVFLNDVNYSTLTITEAQLKPIIYGARSPEMKVPELSVPKREVQLLILRELNPADAMLLPHKQPMMCFTDTYAIRCTFHTGPETREADVLSSSAGLFYPVTDVEVFALRPLGAEVGKAVPMAFVQRDAVHAFFAQNGNGRSHHTS
jgi:hypothetical protein